MAIKIEFHILEIKKLLKLSNAKPVLYKNMRLNSLKIDFTCFSRYKCVKNIQNSCLLSNWIVIQ